MLSKILRRIKKIQGKSIVMFECNPDNYEFGNVIGFCNNRTGTVHLALYKATKTPVVIKKYYIDDKEHEDYSLVETEIKITRQLQHTNVLYYLSAFVSEQCICVVSPLMGYGSCLNLINEHFTEGLPENAIAFILKDVLQGLEYIHKKGFIHRALRASHILISSTGEACICGMRYACEMVKNGKWQRNIYSFPKSTVENLKWLSPEILEQDLHGYNEKSDIYSLGITICELANGVVPFHDVPATLMLTEKVRGCSPHILDESTFPTDVMDVEQSKDSDSSKSSYDKSDKQIKILSTRRFSESFHSITELCLERYPINRPSASQLLSHPFFKQFKKTDETLLDIFKSVKQIDDRFMECIGDPSVKASAEQLGNLSLETYQWDFENT